MKALLAALFLAFWLTNRYATWFLWWSATFFFGTAATVMFVARGFDAEIYAVGLAVAFLVTAFACSWQAARAFERRKILWAPLLAVPTVWLGACLIPGFIESVAARVVLSSLLLALMSAQTAFEFWRGRREELPSRWTVIVLFASVAVLMLARIALLYVLPFPFGALPAQLSYLAAFNLILFFHTILLAILLVALTLVFLLATATLLPFSMFSAAVEHAAHPASAPVTITVLVALLVCLIPTTIGGLLSAIGVAGMSRMMAKNVIATSGRAIEAAGDVDVLLLDKTGTITLGNRQAAAFVPAPGIDERTLAEAAQLASLADETPEGRSIVVLAKQRFQLREHDLHALQAEFVAFTAQTRMSGIDLGSEAAARSIRKGAVDAIRSWVQMHGQALPAQVERDVDTVARRGSTPLVVAEQTPGGGARVLGVVELKDIVKGGIKERFAQLRRMGIRTVMITGDNRLTAAAIAAEAGVDDFLAEATPEAKLKLIREYQAQGRLVAMTGDGTNDAPALAQADVAVAMNSGTQAAKEAGNMVDLDSNPTKLIEIVETGKQMLITRGALTTFSIANDIAKYFAIIPAAFVATYPQLGVLDVMHLASPSSAILSAVIFNALIIVALIPLALKGVRYRAIGAAALLRRNLLVYGLGGIALPFIGIKAIDLLLAAARLA